MECKLKYSSTTNIKLFGELKQKFEIQRIRLKHFYLGASKEVRVPSACCGFVTLLKVLKKDILRSCYTKLLLNRYNLYQDQKLSFRQPIKLWLCGSCRELTLNYLKMSFESVITLEIIVNWWKVCFEMGWWVRFKSTATSW